MLLSTCLSYTPITINRIQVVDRTIHLGVLAAVMGSKENGYNKDCFMAEHTKFEVKRNVSTQLVSMNLQKVEHSKENDLRQIDSFQMHFTED